MTKRKLRSILNIPRRLRSLNHKYYRPSFRRKRKWARFLFRKRAAIMAETHRQMDIIEQTAWEHPNSMRLHEDPYQRPQGSVAIVIDPFETNVRPQGYYRKNPLTPQECYPPVEAIPLDSYSEMEQLQRQQADAMRKMDEVLRQPIDHQVSEFLRKADEEMERHMIWGSPGEQSNLDSLEQSFSAPQDDHDSTDQSSDND